MHRPRKRDRLYPLGHYPLQQGLRHSPEMPNLCRRRPLGHYPLQQGLRLRAQVQVQVMLPPLRALSITTRIKTRRFVPELSISMTPLGHYPLQQGLRPTRPFRRISVCQSALRALSITTRIKTRDRTGCLLLTARSP